uniref:Uncharacterized protein n=1 Tax=Arundo donax TaxID=35708 RepID=A0A0A9HUU7_ARUDO
MKKQSNHEDRAGGHSPRSAVARLPLLTKSVTTSFSSADQ